MISRHQSSETAAKLMFPTTPVRAELFSHVNSFFGSNINFSRLLAKIVKTLYWSITVVDKIWKNKTMALAMMKIFSSGKSFSKILIGFSFVSDLTTFSFSLSRTKVLNEIR